MKMKNIEVINTFIKVLIDAIIELSTVYLAESLLLSSIDSFNCEDCEMTYYWCSCEGCGICGENYCLCDLDIWDHQISYINSWKLRKLCWNLAKKKLNKENFENFKKKLLEKISSYKAHKRNIKNFDELWELFE